MYKESKGKLGQVRKLSQIPIMHLLLTAFLVRKTSVHFDNMGRLLESKGNLGKVRKVILNTNKAPHPKSNLVGENYILIILINLLLLYIAEKLIMLPD